MDAVLHLLCDVRFVWCLFEPVAATSEFMYAVILKTQFGVRVETEVGVESESLVVQFW